MTLYGALEKELIDRLAPLRTADLLVRSLPDTSGDYLEPRGNGRVVLQIMGDNPTKPLTKAPVTQDNTLDLVLDIRLRQIRGTANDSESCYAVLEYVRSVLVGFQPSNARSPIHAAPKGHKFMGQSEKGYWVWESHYQIPWMLRAATPADSGALLKQITFIYSAGIIAPGTTPETADTTLYDNEYRILPDNIQNPVLPDFSDPNNPPC